MLVIFVLVITLQFVIVQMKKQRKLKKCRACREEFLPFNTTQIVCGPKCASDYVRGQRIKAERRETIKRKQALKTNRELLREAQREFNRYIRLRDYGHACISCGRQPNYKASIGGSGVQAGHYRSVGSAPELRFEESNCHVQCFRCNSMESGNIIQYRPALIEKIGIEKVEWLEGPHEPKRYKRDEIIEIKQKYSKKARELEKQLKP